MTAKLQSLADIAINLRALRNLKISELAKHAGLNRPCISLWLGGKPRVVSLENQKRICEFLGWRHGYLLPSKVHMWRINRVQELEAFRLGLAYYIDAEEEKYRISTARYENGKIGYLIFKARKNGMGTLIRLAVAPEFMDVVLSELKAAGEWALSQEVTEKEYQAIWASDSTEISPADYFSDFEPGGFLKSAMEWDSDLWSTEGYLAYVNAQDQEHPDDYADVINEKTVEQLEEEYFQMRVTNNFADIGEEIAQKEQDELWQPLTRKLHAQGLSPQEVEAILQPVLDLLGRSQSKGRSRKQPKTRASSD
jgi:hypothetical protein